MRIRRFFGIFKQAALDFSDDDCMTKAGALAFYGALSLAPLLLLLVWAAGFLGPEGQGAVVRQVVAQTGEQAGGIVRSILRHAQQPQARKVAGIVSFATLLFSATGVFAQLQSSLNRIWNVQAKSAVRDWLRKRLLSLGLIVVMGMLLLVSIGLSAVLVAMFGSWSRVQIAVSLVVYSVLFALMDRFLPDAEVSWRDVWLGAVITAVLFAGGNLLIGMYLGRSGVTSSYGAAGSLIALLLWVYYSALILFYGAELTAAWARAAGRGIVPDRAAVPLEKKRAAPDGGRRDERSEGRRGQPGPAPT